MLEAIILQIVDHKFDETKSLIDVSLLEKNVNETLKDQQLSQDDQQLSKDEKSC